MSRVSLWPAPEVPHAVAVPVFWGIGDARFELAVTGEGVDVTGRGGCGDEMSVRIVSCV